MTDRGTDLTAPDPSRRYMWVDVARGIGIILVVAGHVVRGNFDFAVSPVAREVDRWIYAFHMPLFFLLAGLFLWPAIARGRLAFLRGRWWAVIWPYLLWSIAIGLIEVAMAPYVNSPMQLADVALVAIKPIEQYWFLYVLLVCQLIVLATYRSMVLLALVAAAGLAILVLVGGGWIGMRSFQYLPYVAVGIAASQALHHMARGSALRPVALLLGGGVSLALVLAILGDQRQNVLASFIPAFAGIAACIGASMLIARSPSRPALLLAYIGQASLAIFVLHTLFSAGMRIALKMVGVAAADPANAFLSFAAGLVFPTLAYALASHRDLTRILGFGGSPPSPPPRPSPAPA